MDSDHVRDVQETILVFVLIIDAAHESCSRRQNLVDEDKDSLLGRELYALADNVDKLSDGEVCRHQILLLIDSCDVRLLDLLTDDLQYTDRTALVKQAVRGTSTVQRHQHAAKRPIQQYVESLPGYDPRTSGGCAQLQPCASRRGVRP